MMQPLDFTDDDHITSASEGEYQASHNTGQPRKSEDRWLSIDGACKIVGVDQSTLRRWSNGGKLPVSRTPGGHRRYREHDLRAFMRGDRPDGTSVNRSELVSLSLKQFESTYQKEASERGWYQACDSGAESELHEIGRQMIDLTMSYVSAGGDRETIVAQGRVIGRRYGRCSARAGLSTRQVLEALLFFRRPVLDAVRRYIEDENLSQTRACRIYDELTGYMDETLISTIRSYETASQ